MAAYKFRLVMLGRPGVGKSALTVKYLTQRFIMEYDPYLDGKYSKIDILNDEPVVVKVWDTYTHPGTRIELDRYLKWADGFVVVYSVTDRSSLLEAQAYLKHIKIQCRNKELESKPIVLIGNKSDLDSHRQVSHTEASRVAEGFGTLFHECSAAGNMTRVEMAFHSLIQVIYRQRVLSSPAATSSKSESITKSGSLPKTLVRRKSSSPKLIKKSHSTLKLFSRSFKIFT